MRVKLEKIEWDSVHLAILIEDIPEQGASAPQLGEDIITAVVGVAAEQFVVRDRKHRRFIK